MIEQTLVLVKPDGVARGLVGEVISRFENRGLKIVALKMVKIDTDFSKKHYAAHVDKDFYAGLENFIVSGPVIAMIVEGVDAIENVRKLCGATESKSALPGTIRGDYSHVSYSHADEKGMAIKNIIHASGDKEDAEKEVSLWFSVDELHGYSRSGEEHVF
ncbi:nucleoside-diphosphate kinase [archaeon]|jgi:nucleoside-diphosphate kinase|nr:nucleoside-diphosphate kinase [archaeon]MBT6182500.1 nucleoside-diphosphate kinase [archaeon]MBT6606190.1 nucleoside-diphosphate kinase [archaeon]MBT7251641.1 nucleoside-diphosphate kinase [archaeon]MBT7661069.1 nucleoside-diphosphate kinase [archaeon]